MRILDHLQILAIGMALLGICGLSYSCRERSVAPPSESELVGAVMAGRTTTVDSLLRAGAAPNSMDEEGTPVLILAVNRRHRDMVELLVAAGADVNARRQAYFRSTALMEAGVRNDPELVRYLLEQGADLDLRDTLGDTPLNWAAYYGHVDLVALYLERGADWSVESKQGSAVDIALHRGHRNLARFFIERGVGKTLDAESQRLIRGIQQDDLPAVRRALDQGASPDQTDELDTPALVLAAELGREEILRHLLRSGADLNAMNRVGETALARAARFGHAGIVNVLLTAEASINLAGAPYDLTPLHLAAQTGHTEIVQELLASGAAVNAQEGINGYTPLMLATAGGHAEAVRALLAGGASPYIKSFEGAGLYDMLRYSNDAEVGEIIRQRLLED